jgi:hypothetical protein
MRKDVYIQNDSGAYCILSSAVLPRVVEDQRENDAQFVEAHEVVLLSLVGDDSFVARVVVGEELTAQEQNDWIARICWPLKVPCGKLVVSGGYDPDVLAEILNGDSSTVVDVPPGEYVAEVLTYLNTMNGRVHREQWGDAGKVGSWFRAEHPGKPFSSWVAAELVRDPEEDPGHEAEWRDLRGSFAGGKLKIQLDPISWVGVVIHLKPRTANDELSEPGPDGFFSDDAGLRRPAHFPLGIPSAVLDEEPRSWLRDILPK